jgi:hypothetical protein
MKQKLWLFLFTILLSLSLFAQQATGFGSVSDAGKMAERILDAAGRKANFQIKEAKVPNAVAVLTNGRRFILYNPDFINRLTSITGTQWAAVSVLAHEIGHHLYTHRVNGKTVPMASELEADRFSGYVLRKMGANLHEAQAAMKTLASTRATRTHPGRDDRLKYIADGWDRADGEPGTIAVVSSREPGIPRDISASVGDNINKKSFLADIHFTADPGVKYHVTSAYNVVKVKNNEVTLVGKLTRLNNRSFPYMIYDANENRVYVDSEGEIVNRRGNVIGKIVSPRS